MRKGLLGFGSVDFRNGFEIWQAWENWRCKYDVDVEDTEGSDFSKNFGFGVLDVRVRQLSR